MTSGSIIHMDLHKPNNKLNNPYWNIFYAQTSQGHTWIYKIHHNLDLGETTTFPFILFPMITYSKNSCMELANDCVSPFSRGPLLGRL